MQKFHIETSQPLCTEHSLGSQYNETCLYSKMLNQNSWQLHEGSFFYIKQRSFIDMMKRFTKGSYW